MYHSLFDCKIFSQNTLRLHSGHPPPFLQKDWGGGGGRLSLQLNFQKKGGLDRTSTFRWG